MILEPAGGAGKVVSGVTVIVLRGKLAEVRAVVPASMLTAALLSDEATFAEVSNTPLLSTILPHRD